MRLTSVTQNEAKTRALHIDPQLRAADWKLNDRTQVRLEVPVDGYDAEPWNGVTDYCLYDASGNVLAVVEAKRCSRNAREADEQLRHYVTEIGKRQPFAPFGFMANGHDIWFWEVGLANPRLVAGFFTPADLERMKFLRQNRQPLESTPINNSIVDRAYQHEAIRRVAECALVRTPPQRLMLPDTIFRFRLKRGSRLSPVFLWGLFSFPSFRTRVQALAGGSAGSMPGISKSKFMSISCPVPPPVFQQEFAALVDRVEHLRAVQLEAARQAEHLFASLLDRAFRI
jgi:hypothetical protein